MKKIPGVTSFKRATVLSDGVFFNVDENGVESKMVVIRHGIRGTQNLNKGDGAKEVSNIQVTETARTEPDSRQFGVRFSIRMLPLDSALDSCAGTDAEMMRAGYTKFVSAAIESEGLQEVARRIARNLLNGRWLWRNRTLGQEVIVQVDGESLVMEGVDALSISLNHFNDYSEQERELGAFLAKSLRGHGSNDALTVTATIDLGFTGSVEAFPSQNYVESKPEGFARPLYKLGGAAPVTSKLMGHESLVGFNDVRIMGQAALRDQKIGNALRTIDTWYPDADENDGKPIPVEPAGASLDAMKFYRKTRSGSSAFDIALRLAELDPDSPDGMFMIAALIRGGVYGESDK
jgi:CRISPR-associated protein Csy3